MDSVSPGSTATGQSEEPSSRFVVLAGHIRHSFDPCNANHMQPELLARATPGSEPQRVLHKQKGLLSTSDN